MMVQALIFNLGLALTLTTLLWLLSIRLRDVSIVDPYWGPGFAIIAAASFLHGSGDPRNLWDPLATHEPRQLIVLIMVALWGLRLGIYLLRRNIGHGEDFRYAAMREHHGARFWWLSLFTVFTLQGFLQWFVALPAQVALLQHHQSALGPLDFVGLGVWGIGLFFEAVGDWQLARFKADPANRGKVLDRGLWRYTRHPNYFGDAMIWWGVWIVSASAPGGLWTIASPALMMFLVMRVSGVTMLERTLAERPHYRDYIARTSAFFPWPPKS